MRQPPPSDDRRDPHVRQRGPRRRLAMNGEAQDAAPVIGRCPACGRPLQMVHVHGHGQCGYCGTTVEPCCAGAGDEAELAAGPRQRSEALPLRALFADLGDPSAAVTHDALTHAVCCRVGCDLAEACERLLHEVEQGRLLRVEAGVYRLP
jgi:hypothetical protein